VSDIPYTNDLETLRPWVGRTQELVETVQAASCRRMEATLNREPSLEIGDVLPALWHFITHVPDVPMSRLGRDGHPMRGGFLPPVALPRRMWAGGRFRFHGDIHVGDEVTKRSTIDDITMKDGRTGPLCFVTVTHQLLVDGDVRIEEEQDVVYREDPAPDAEQDVVYREDPAPDTPKPEPKPAPDGADFTRTVTPSEAMLFRYSALTFNSHRIHYDRDYAREVEGYDGLVFHGPLTATLLADLAMTETTKPLASFSFRGLAPLFDDAAFTISGVNTADGCDLWATTPSGGIAMKASATFG